MRSTMMVLLVLAACGDKVGECPDGDPIPWYADEDGDGYGAGEATEACDPPSGHVDTSTDCDDANPAIHPDAAEICNGLDDDCSGVADDGASAGSFWYDADADGHGDPTQPVEACEQGNLATSGDDCDDGDAGVHPGADEVCNGNDDDCDGLVDEDGVDGPTWYLDGDDDGYGGEQTTEACEEPAGYVGVGGDCDDGDDGIHPGAEEHCDGVDEDCNGLIDDGAVDGTVTYTDDDEDGFGLDASAERSCGVPGGRVLVGGDCDDTDPERHPDAWWYPDADGDGYAGPGGVQQCEPPSGYQAGNTDCNDSDPAIHPEADELCNAVDDDCDGIVDDDPVDGGVWFADADADGYGNPAVSITSCDPPGPGWVADATDCDDTRDTFAPGAEERCDEEDNDCDGLVDAADPDFAGAGTWYADVDGDGYGDVSDVLHACEAPKGRVEDGTDCDDANPAIHYGATEVCDGIDNDCDGQTDGADAIDSVLYFADGDGDGYGNPDTTLYSCASPTGYVEDGTDCNDMNPDVHPYAAEPCGVAMDMNCDGSFGLVDLDEDGWAACDECDDSQPDVYPGAPELCDLIDNDCNGLVDDDGMGGSPWAFYVDDDGDGFGAPGSFLVDCGGWVSGYADNDDDCDDTEAAVNPAAPEECNGIDDDCDGVVPIDEFDGDGDGYAPCDGDKDDSDPDVFPFACTYIEDFEDGVWPAPGWVSVDGGGSVGPSYAHDGSYGLYDPGWHYMTGPSFGSSGEVLAGWVLPSGSGRVYVGFAAGASGAKSLVIAPNTTQFLFQENSSYGYSDMTSASQTYTLGKWYYVEIEFLGGNTVQGNLYDSDGVSLINSIVHTYGSSVLGGLAIRSFSSFYSDSFALCAGS